MSRHCSLLQSRQVLQFAGGADRAGPHRACGEPHLTHRACGEPHLTHRACGEPHLTQQAPAQPAASGLAAKIQPETADGQVQAGGPVLQEARWAPWPAITAAACAAAIGCGGGGAGGGRIPNRPPVVDADSLKWVPADAEVALDAPYTYSVKAADMDIGDRIVRYEWIFGDAAGGGSVRYETAAPSVTHTLDASLVAAEGGVFAAKLLVGATDDKGAAGQRAAFSIPVSPGRAAGDPRPQGP